MSQIHQASEDETLYDSFGVSASETFDLDLFLTPWEISKERHTPELGDDWFNEEVNSEDYDSEFSAIVEAFSDVDAYIHDNGFSTASSEDLQYLEFPEKHLSLENYRENVPFYVGEYWHIITGTAQPYGATWRFYGGSILNGQQIPVKQGNQGSFLTTFIRDSQVCFIQLGRLNKKTKTSGFFSCRARRVVFCDTVYFLIRSTEVIAFVFDVVVTAAAIGRFHRFYTGVSFDFQHEQFIKIGLFN